MPAVVPWIPASPPPFVVPAVAPACRLANLRVGGVDPRAGIFDNGASGALTGGVVLTNAGPPCSLLGRPAVRLVGGPVARVRLKQTAFDPGAPPLDVLPAFSVRALPTGSAAYATLWWSNWCAPGNPGAGNLSPPPTALEVALPAGGSVRFPVRGAPRCDAPEYPSTVAVGAFTPLVPQPKQTTRLPFALAVDAPSTARPGTVLRYRVTLRNTRRRAFRFGACPTYFEELGAAHELHVLDCGPARTIAPDASVTFAMELRLPPTLRTGPDGIFWELGPGTYLPPSASARVVVTR